MAPLFLGKWCGVAIYLFLYIKKKKKNYDWIVPFIDWIKNYIFEKKLKIYIVLGLSYNLPKYMVFCPSYILPPQKKR